MANTYFRFKQFTVHQDKSAMKVGTDGVLLGAWSDCENLKNILDIGTGTGLIALMLAQRSQALIDAIDIDKSSCEQALENVTESLWKNRIQIIHSSLQHYEKQCNIKYDLIVSNPPFFINSLKSEKNERNIVRHNDLLPFDDLISCAFSLLNEAGRFCIILPFTEGNIFIEMASEKMLYCSRKTTVFPCLWKKPSRLLLEFQKQEIRIADESLTIEMDGRHQYSNEYKKLTSEFYLDH